MNNNSTVTSEKKKSKFKYLQSVCILSYNPIPAQFLPLNGTASLELNRPGNPLITKPAFTAVCPSKRYMFGNRAQS